MTVRTIKNEVQFASASHCHRADHTSELWYPLPIKVSGPTYNCALWHATEFNLMIVVIKSNFIRRYTLNYHQVLFYLMLDSSHCAPSNKTVHCELYVLYLHDDTGQFPLINPCSWWNVEMYDCICFPNGSIVNKVNTFVGKLSVRMFSFVYLVCTGIV